MTPNYPFWHYYLWPQFAGIVYVVMAVIAVWPRLSFKLDALPILGRVFVPAPLAVFGAEHLSMPQAILQGVPSWMPVRLLWVYVVGIALFAAATSIAWMQRVRESAALLGIMFFIFVASIHVPLALADPHNRFRWAVVLRDLSFGVGAWMLATTQMDEQHEPLARRLVNGGRIVFGLVFLVYGVEHLLHPEFTPGVPLKQLTPAWIPMPSLWGYVVGVALLIGGVALLINRHARTAATCVGLVVALVVPLINLPMLVVARGPLEVITGVNFVYDTMLFAGAILLLATALPANAAAVRTGHDPVPARLA